MNLHDAHSSRRSFLARGASLSALAAFPNLRVSAKGVAAPNERVNLAAVGIGNRAGDIIEELDRTGLCNVVALCDTDMGAPHTRKLLKKYFGLPRFRDFRQMLDKTGNQIDAVCVGTPDHSHFPACMMAMGLGKHVYVEKPLAHTYQQIALLMKAEQKYKVAAQMGNQGHSGANYFQFKAWVEAGVIKNVRKVVAHMNGARRWHKWNGLVAGLPPAQTVPSTLDWDTWLAQVPFHEYNADYTNGDWRCWYDFGNGALGDWGAHIIDTVHEFMHLGLPTEVNVVKMEGHNPYVFPMASTLAFKFPARGASLPACELFWHDGVNNFPELPADYGEAVSDDNIPPPGGGSGTVNKLAPGKEIYTDDLVFKGASHESVLSIIPDDKSRQMASRLPAAPESPSNHFKNFLLACKGLELCRSRFAVSGPLCQAMALGIIAQRLNANLIFDPVAQRIKNNQVADALLFGPPPRQGWEQYYKI